MNEQEYEALLRKALREPKWWAEVTAQESDAIDALRTLRQWWTRVNDDMTLSKLKMAEAEAAKVAGAMHPKELAKIRAEQLTWRRKAEGFRIHLRDKIIELELRLGDRARSPKAGIKTANSERDQAMRAEHAEARVKYRKKLRILAAAIHLHQSDEIDDGTLYSLLDELEIPIHDDGAPEPYDLTLRQAIDAGKLQDAIQHVSSLKVGMGIS